MHRALVVGAGGCTVTDLDDDLVVRRPPREVPVTALAGLDGPDVRWLWEDTATTYPALLAAGVRLRACHDVRATERILLGRQLRHGEPVAVAAVLARAAGRPAPPDPPERGTVPAPVTSAAEPLFGADLLPAAPERADPVAGPCTDPVQLAAALRDQLSRSEGDAALRLLLAAESASVLAAAEIGHVGLPLRAAVHDATLTALLGPRPSGTGRPRELARLAARISEAFGREVNPDSATELREAFRREGFDISTTRAQVVRELAHPAVPDVLRYKELARLWTANGWSWLDEWVHDDRFRAEYLPGGVVSGRWAARGGGGLQLPGVVRTAVLADPGHVLVVSDAAQLEPRVLAALSGDRVLLELSGDSSQSGDLYTALAEDGFGGDRSRAKVAMLGAMYGATTGESGRLLPVLRRRYPAAIACVEEAAQRGERGEAVRSVLGRTSPLPGEAWRRLVALAPTPVVADGVEPGTGDDGEPADERRARSAQRSWGRFTRNFVVQASAADWAAVWLSVLRRSLADVPGAELVLFQHDELVVHVPAEHADRVAGLIVEAAHRARDLVFPGSPVATPVRPVVVRCYADAK